MTAPNLSSAATFTGGTSTCVPDSFLLAKLLVGNTTANTVLKINSVYITNTDVSTSAAVSLYYFPTVATQANMDALTITAANRVPICHLVSVSPNTTTVVVTKDSSIYLTETQCLGVIGLLNVVTGTSARAMTISELTPFTLSAAPTITVAVGDNILLDHEECGLIATVLTTTTFSVTARAINGTTAIAHITGIPMKINRLPVGAISAVASYETITA